MKVSLVIPAGRKYSPLLRFLKNELRKPRSEFRKLPIFVISQYPQALYFSSPNVHFFLTKEKAASVKRNIGLKLARTPWVAFLDDDCVPTSQWLQTLLEQTNNSEKSELVFGKVLAKKMRIDPVEKRWRTGLFVKRKKPFCPTPGKIKHHADEVGISANFYGTRESLLRIGGFTPWLGPGAFFFAGEDADVILRWQERGLEVGYAPSLAVEHYKSLSFSAYVHESCKYILGGIFVYAFHFFQGKVECVSILNHYVREAVQWWSRNLPEVRIKSLFPFVFSGGLLIIGVPVVLLSAIVLGILKRLQRQFASEDSVRQSI
jgi:cellulose synthase/poly-beta-1,6-N-acetylglucosamine synthase-like glycosyltransferase